jgi:hypothetical protein
MPVFALQYDETLSNSSINEGNFTKKEHRTRSEFVR